VAEAIRLAHRALELDPRFGLVAALAGVSHTRNVFWGYATDPQFDRKEAVRLLRLALSLDDSDADTLTTFNTDQTDQRQFQLTLNGYTQLVTDRIKQGWSC